MRKLALAGVAAIALAASGVLMSGLAEAAVTGPSQGINAAADNLNMMQDVQYRFQNRRHCWYNRGWNGEGWYQCGYHVRHGRGWGGGEGWNGWERRRVESRGYRY